MVFIIVFGSEIVSIVFILDLECGLLLAYFLARSLLCRGIRSPCVRGLFVEP